MRQFSFTSRSVSLTLCLTLVLAALPGLAAANSFAKLTAPLYEASTVVSIGDTSTSSDEFHTAYSIEQVRQSIQLMHTRPKLRTLARQVDLDLRAESAAELERMLDKLEQFIRIKFIPAQSGFNGSRVRICVRDPDPQMAKDLVQSQLSTFVEGLIKLRQELDEGRIEHEQVLRKLIEDEPIAAVKAQLSTLLAQRIALRWQRSARLVFAVNEPPKVNMNPTILTSAAEFCTAQ